MSEYLPILNYGSKGDSETENDAPKSQLSKENKSKEELEQLEEEKLNAASKDSFAIFEAGRRLEAMKIMTRLLSTNVEDEDELCKALAHLNGDEVDQVAEERCLGGKCGNPMCTTPCSSKGKRKFKLTKSNNIVDLQEVTNYCSSECLEKMKTLLEAVKRLCSDSPNGQDLKAVSEHLSKFPVSHTKRDSVKGGSGRSSEASGNSESVMESQIKERSGNELCEISPSSENAETNLSVEGYVPRSASKKSLQGTPGSKNSTHSKPPLDPKRTPTKRSPSKAGKQAAVLPNIIEHTENEEDNGGAHGKCDKSDKSEKSVITSEEHRKSESLSKEQNGSGVLFGDCETSSDNEVAESVGVDGDVSQPMLYFEIEDAEGPLERGPNGVVNIGDKFGRLRVVDASQLDLESDDADQRQQGDSDAYTLTTRGSGGGSSQGSEDATTSQATNDPSRSPMIPHFEPPSGKSKVKLSPFGRIYSTLDSLITSDTLSYIHEASCKPASLSRTNVEIQGMKVLSDTLNRTLNPIVRLLRIKVSTSEIEKSLANLMGTFRCPRPLATLSQNEWQVVMVVILKMLSWERLPGLRKYVDGGDLGSLLKKVGLDEEKFDAILFVGSKERQM